MRPHADESRHAVARAAIDARDFARAREVLQPIIAERPTQNALILMAELEEAETGDRGRARGWLARAVHAPRDPAWTADGVVLEEWAPVSPVTGKLDAVEWKVPLAEIEGPRLDIDPRGDLATPAAPAQRRRGRSAARRRRGSARTRREGGRTETAVASTPGGAAAGGARRQDGQGRAGGPPGAGGAAASGRSGRQRGGRGRGRALAAGILAQRLKRQPCRPKNPIVRSTTKPH